MEILSSSALISLMGMTVQSIFANEVSPKRRNLLFLLAGRARRGSCLVPNQWRMIWTLSVLSTQLFCFLYGGGEIELPSATFVTGAPIEAMEESCWCRSCYEAFLETATSNQWGSIRLLVLSTSRLSPRYLLSFAKEKKSLWWKVRVKTLSLVLW